MNTAHFHNQPTPPSLPQPAQSHSASPLNDEQLTMITQANHRAKKLQTAQKVAQVNGYMFAICSAGSFLFVVASALFGSFDFLSLIMGIGLGIVAWSEFRGKEMLRRFELRSCRLLGWNQIGLMLLIIAYSAWMGGNALLGPNPYAEAIANEPALAKSLGDIGELYKIISIAIYGGMIAGTIIFQGLNAIYYFTRQKYLNAYLHQTPKWIVELQQRNLAA